MKVPAGLAPLVRRTTYLRAVHLLLGGVLLLPYLLLGVAFVELMRSATPRPLTLILLGLTAVIAGAPLFLRATRTLQIAAARALLGVDLPDPAPGPLALEARLRGALWSATHLTAGGLLGLAMLIALPMAASFLAMQFWIGPEAVDEFQLGPFDQHDTGALSLLGLAMLGLLLYGVAGLGALAATMAPVLLGPSTAERIIALEAEASQLAERNRLARELHDSVGHALTVTTLQAAAAREVLDTDPEFVARALRAVEETGRAAMAELDHVLGLLRDDRSGPAPTRTLAQLDQLLAEAGAVGQVAAEVTGPLAELPAVVSREGYRIVQESLTNAARHAGGRPVSLRISVAADALTIEATNPVSAAPSQPDRPAGRGLAGIRERVAVLGGRMSAGRSAGQWRLAVRLPLGTRARLGKGAS